MGNLCSRPSKHDPFASPGRTLPPGKPSSSATPAGRPARASVPSQSAGRTLGGGGGGEEGSGGETPGGGEARANAAIAAQVGFLPGDCCDQEGGAKVG
jgi:hypothetical protein